MNKEEIKKLSSEMIKKFVDCLGLDGDYYITVSNCHIVYVKDKAASEFLNARSHKLKRILDKANISEEKKKQIYDDGLIIINKDLNQLDERSNLADLFESVIHERIHCNRMLLINSQKSENRAIGGVLYNDGHFVRNYLDIPQYADSSQEILKASIDDSQKTYEHYSTISDEDKMNMTDAFEYSDKMEQQRKIDEALVETIAKVAFRLYKSNSNDILDEIKKLNNEKDVDNDVKAITSIILRHNDLELLKWMIDPITYEIGSTNYDYFSHYINDEDLGDFNDLLESNDTMFDDDLYDNYIIRTRKK